jgi:hypothetical protein
MSNRLTAALSIATIIVPLVGAPTVALGIDNGTADRLGHFVDCLSWMINDPVKHDKYCLPSQVTQEQLDGMRGPNFTPSPPTASSSSSSLSSSSRVSSSSG